MLRFTKLVIVSCSTANYTTRILNRLSLIFALFASFAARTYDSIATFRFMVSKTFLMVLGCDLAGRGLRRNIPQGRRLSHAVAEGCGRRLRVDAIVPVG